MTHVGDIVYPEAAVAQGSTVMLKPPAGTFLRRELQYGIAGQSEGDGGEFVWVTWGNGVASRVPSSTLWTITDPGEKARGLLLSTVSTKYGGGMRSHGVVVAAFGTGKQDYVVVESALGLLFVVPPEDVTPVPNK